MDEVSSVWSRRNVGEDTKRRVWILCLCCFSSLKMEKATQVTDVVLHLVAWRLLFWWKLWDLKFEFYLCPTISQQANGDFMLTLRQIGTISSLLLFLSLCWFSWFILLPHFLSVFPVFVKLKWIFFCSVILNIVV